MPPMSSWCAIQVVIHTEYSLVPYVRSRTLCPSTRTEIAQGPIASIILKIFHLRRMQNTYHLLFKPLAGLIEGHQPLHVLTCFRNEMTFQASDTAFHILFEMVVQPGSFTGCTNDRPTGIVNLLVCERKVVLIALWSLQQEAKCSLGEYVIVIIRICRGVCDYTPVSFIMCVGQSNEYRPGGPCSLIIAGPLVSPALSWAAARDLDADAESESASRRGVFLGGEPDRVFSFAWLTLSSDGRNLEKARDEGSVRSVDTSTRAAIVLASVRAISTVVEQ